MEPEINLYLSKTFIRKSDIVSTVIDTDLVMMSIDQGKYYGTGAVGHRIWELLQEPLSGAKLVDTLLTEFMVERPVCEEEVTAFIKQLHEEGLIEVN